MRSRVSIAGMRRIAALALVPFVAACGHSAAKPKAPAAPAINVTISAPTHQPRVNKPWPVTVRVTDAAGKPLPAQLTMRILFGGTPVGKVDNGRVYRFVGMWREEKGNEITWPRASRGQPLQFEAIVTARGKTVKRTWSIQVR
jgi:hypothetical protein